MAKDDFVAFDVVQQQGNAVRGGGLARAAFVQPVTPAECLIADLWSDLLRVEGVGLDDSFFGLGGDSLTALRVVMRISDRLHVSLEPKELFEHPTVRGFADHVVRKIVG